jgi:hypothetical protein
MLEWFTRLTFITRAASPDISFRRMKCPTGAARRHDGSRPDRGYAVPPGEWAVSADLSLEDGRVLQEWK